VEDVKYKGGEQEAYKGEKVLTFKSKKRETRDSERESGLGKNRQRKIKKREKGEGKGQGGIRKRVAEPHQNYAAPV
jgi:hypothetical protein